jgi:hypothetical protein
MSLTEERINICNEKKRASQYNNRACIAEMITARINAQNSEPEIFLCGKNRIILSSTVFGADHYPTIFQEF